MVLTFIEVGEVKGWLNLLYTHTVADPMATLKVAVPSFIYVIQVMVTFLLLLSNLMTNCLPVCLSMSMIRSSTGSCGVGVVIGKRHS